MRTVIDTVIEAALLGKVARPDHPVTPLNPNGREGFIVTEVERSTDGRFVLRGKDTMWFGESSILEIKGAP